MISKKERLKRVERDIEALRDTLERRRVQEEERYKATLVDLTNLYGHLLSVQRLTVDNGNTDKELLACIEETREVLDGLKARVDIELDAMKLSHDGDKKEYSPTFSEIMDEYLNGGRDGRESDN